jgi:hypothetical protein
VTLVDELGNLAEQAIARFEEKKRTLYRRDGTKLFSTAEHDERLAAYTEELRAEVEGLIGQAERQAAHHEELSRSTSYNDPTRGLSREELARLDALRPLIAEDFERLSAPVLMERLKAVAAGNDDVAKALHARYASFRAHAIKDELDAAARDGRAMPEETAARLRELEEAATLLSEQLADPGAKRRREEAEKAAQEYRRGAFRLRQRLMEADGTDAAAREEYEATIHAGL